MRLAELLIRKENLDKKITEMEEFLIRLVRNDGVAQKELVTIRSDLNDYIDKSQQYSMKICEVNEQINIEVANSSVVLSDALKILSTLEKKIVNITNLIGSSNGNLDIRSFQSQRDQLYEEHILLNNAIRMSEWSADFD